MTTRTGLAADVSPGGDQERHLDGPFLAVVIFALMKYSPATSGLSSLRLAIWKAARSDGSYRDADIQRAVREHGIGSSLASR